MYHSIGSSMAVRTRTIIVIFDLDTTSCSKHTRQFLREAERNGQVVAAGEELPKSFLLTREFGMDRVYLTQFSAQTMEKRISKEEASCPNL